MEYTPREWKVAGDVNTSLWITGNNDEGCVVAKIQTKIYDERLDWQEAQANARLIASAPDLYEACKYALAQANWTISHSEDDKEALLNNIRDEMIEALAKAEGKHD